MLSLNKISLTNKILYLINFIIAIGVIIFFLLSKGSRLNVSENRAFIRNHKIELSTTKPYPYYAKLVSNRYLFTPLAQEEEPTIKIELPPKPSDLPLTPSKLSEPSSLPPKLLPPPPEPKIPLEKRVSNLTLIGVVFDEGGATAIIQDRIRHHEYFLKKGDSIQGVKIEEILEDKVILKDGEEMEELRL